MGTSTEYETTRAAYWAAQEAHRQAAVAEIQLLMPHNVETIILEVNDTPRLAFAAFVVDGEESESPEDINDVAYDNGLYDTVDQIACDMEVFSWDEGRGFLFGHEDGVRFVVARAGA